MATVCKYLRILYRLTFILVFTVSILNAQTRSTNEIRPPAVAGGFYPADKNELDKTVTGLLNNASKVDSPGIIRGLIVPHAGYEYSGSVAAEAYKQVAGLKYDAVIIIAPSHREIFPGASIYPGTALETPLGKLDIEKVIAFKIVNTGNFIQFSKTGYGQEHSLEVQLPFIQKVFPGTPVVPIVVGRQSFEAGYKLAAVLGKALKGMNVLIVASTDLSHFHSYDEAVKLDKDLVDALENYDPFLLGLNIFNRRWEACGGTPVMAALLTAQKLGCNNVRIMKYANSGDVTGDKSSVVGYVSAIITESTKSENDYNDDERKFLLEYAKETVEYSVNRKEAPRRPSLPEKLEKKRGVFVTLRIDGKMRGCIGEIFARNPLLEAVHNCAINSALKDERFKPVSEKELPGLDYEISVLSPLRPLEDVSDLIIGKHGLFIVYGQLSGIILPQVAVEFGWNRTQFLEAVCRKAGLQIGAWKAPNALVFLYSAEVFGDHN